MALHYGVLRGRVDIFKREDDLSTPHLQVRVAMVITRRGECRSMSYPGDQSHVISHRADPLQNYPLLAALPQVTAGFTLLPPAYALLLCLGLLSGAAIRLANRSGCPLYRPGADDDLQDVLITYLKQLREQDGELFVFGGQIPGAR